MEKCLCTFIPTSDLIVHTGALRTQYLLKGFCVRACRQRGGASTNIHHPWLSRFSRPFQVSRDQRLCTVTSNFVSACSSFQLIRPLLLDGWEMKVFRLSSEKHCICIQNDKILGKEFYCGLVRPLALMCLSGMLTFPVNGAFDTTYWYLGTFALTWIASSAASERIHESARVCWHWSLWTSQSLPWVLHDKRLFSHQSWIPTCCPVKNPAVRKKSTNTRAHRDNLVAVSPQSTDGE